MSRVRITSEDVAIVQSFLLALGVLVVVGAACWMVFAAVAAGVSARSLRRSGSRLRWRERRGLARLDRTIRPVVRELPRHPVDPPIEEVAADLRRLRNQRLGIARRSQVWLTAVGRAYDDRLRVACRELRIAEHLAELDGIDLEIERVRVEGALQAAGVQLYTSGAGRRPDRR